VPDKKAFEESIAVGERIKHFRESAGMSLEDLSERTGLSTAELKEIEQDMISPALGVLTKICGGLGVRLGHFFQQGPRKVFSLVRSDDQEEATRFASKSGTDHGYEYRSLGSEKRQRTMDPFLVIIEPPSGQVEPESPMTHDGEEFLYLLEGQIEVQLQGQDFTLNPGDSIYYDATVPHRVIQVGDLPAKVLVVVTLPTSPTSQNLQAE
jgi:transcriptional regulator with XRE-family HTH domain